MATWGNAPVAGTAEVDQFDVCFLQFGLFVKENRQIDYMETDIPIDKQKLSKMT